jgi:hypothetical protein
LADTFDEDDGVTIGGDENGASVLTADDVDPFRGASKQAEVEVNPIRASVVGGRERGSRHW